MLPMTFWERGTHIMWRYGRPGLDFAAPMTVARDDERGLVAWLAVSTPVLKLVREDGRDLRAERSDGFTVPRRQVESVWEHYSVLRVYQPGRRWSVWYFFHGETGVFGGWYVNIEDPHVRADRTTRSRDHVLDIWVEPDRTFQRKDEDELILAVEQGRYSQGEADAITAVADEVEGDPGVGPTVL
jgi:predicted RNA-binding protein associated with RNAse of E/G family